MELCPDFSGKEFPVFLDGQRGSGRADAVRGRSGFAPLIPSPFLLPECFRSSCSSLSPRANRFLFITIEGCGRFFNFLSFAAGTGSICFSVIDSSSHFSPTAFGAALQSSVNVCSCWSSAFAAVAPAQLLHLHQASPPGGLSGCAFPVPCPAPV